MLAICVVVCVGNETAGLALKETKKIREKWGWIRNTALAFCAAGQHHHSKDIKRKVEKVVVVKGVCFI